MTWLKKKQCKLIIINSFEIKINKGEPQSIQESKDDTNNLYVLNHNALYLIDQEGKTIKEYLLSFEARAFAVTSTKKYFIGDKVNLKIKLVRGS